MTGEEAERTSDRDPNREQSDATSEPEPSHARRRRRRKRRTQPRDSESAAAARLTQDDRHWLLTMTLAVAMGISGLLAINAVGRVPVVLFSPDWIDTPEFAPTLQDMAEGIDDDGRLPDPDELRRDWLHSRIPFFILLACFRTALAFCWMALYFFWKPGLSAAIFATTALAVIETCLGDPLQATVDIMICGAIVFMVFRLKPVTWSLYRSWDTIFPAPDR